jgi:hypothetical protein
MRRFDLRIAACAGGLLLLAVAAVGWTGSRSGALDNRETPAAGTSARADERAQTADVDVDAVLLELSRIREWIYAEIDVAASSDYLIDFHWQATAEEMLHAFRTDQGGVLCAGAAQLLHAVYRDLGHESYVLHYGILGGLTHAVVIVRVGGEFYVQDPYFNYAFSQPLSQIIEQLVIGKLPAMVEGAPQFRDVHRRPDGGIWPPGAWAIDPEHPDSQCRLRPDGREVCRAVHSPDMFVSRFPIFFANYFVTLDRAAEFGLPRDIRSLLMFPYGLFGPQGYISDAESPLNNGVFGEIVRLVRQATGGRLDPAAIPENIQR